LQYPRTPSESGGAECTQFDAGMGGGVAGVGEGTYNK
jgi:hypothetical protein